MSEKFLDTAASQQVEIMIGRLEGLSILPCVAARFLEKVCQPQFSSSAIADIAESDPAIALKILSLLDRQQISKPGEKFSLRQAIDKLAANEIREAVLSMEVLCPFDCDGRPEQDTTMLRRELLLHSIAVACCAKDIADVGLSGTDAQMAYCAGLLHDIGKFAIHETMPKSFLRIIEEAKSAKSSSYEVEHKRLGADHTIFGKRLAQKLGLPEEITLAIWLHHSDTGVICESMPDARIASVVQLADCIAREVGIGQSGSFDTPVITSDAMGLFEINSEQLQQIRLSLPEKAKEKSRILGLDLPNPLGDYWSAVHDACARLTRDNTKLSLDSQRLQADSSHFSFITDFLLSINTNSPAIGIAENLASRWQKFYQTGVVCLYLAPPAGAQTVQAVVVERLAQSKTAAVDVPDGVRLIPEALANSFKILDTGNQLDWLLGQLDVEFDAGHAKLVPLCSNGKTVAVIAFELHWPIDTQLFEERLKTSASIAGTVLELAVAWEKQQRLSEQLVRAISRSKQTRAKISPADSSLIALAEIAAGAAHELNNPLAVISGRAQLLAKAETDQQKREVLRQIQDNAAEASAVIEDLMDFAQPPPSRRTLVGIAQVLDEAMELTRQKTNTEHINAQIKAAPDVPDVFVDSGQIVSAIANVIANAVESYSDKMGPIKITAETSGSFVKLQVKDLGCGMGAETLRKATYPFFSAKPAGRRRGMGLAYTARFIQLNEGLLNIESEPGEGTTVTIYLPRK